MISPTEHAGGGSEGDLALRNILEALLFASSDSLSVARLSAALKEVEPSAIRKALTDLGEACDREARPYRLEQIGGGYRLLTRPEYAEYIRRLQKISSGDRLSPAALETLAIIAYKQPVIKAEVDAIRGVKSEGTIHGLLRRHLIRVVGRAEVLGRPLLYGTTKLFLDQFGLKNLEDLPSSAEALEKMEAEELPPIEEAQVTQVDLDAERAVEDDILKENLPEVPAFRKDEVLEAAEAAEAARLAREEAASDQAEEVPGSPEMDGQTQGLVSGATNGTLTSDELEPGPKAVKVSELEKKAKPHPEGQTERDSSGGVDPGN